MHCSIIFISTVNSKSSSKRADNLAFYTRRSISSLLQVQENNKTNAIVVKLLDLIRKGNSDDRENDSE